MSLESLYPSAGDHAILSAVFAIEFQSRLSLDTLLEIEKAVTKAYGDEFPVVVQQQTMSLDFTAGLGSQQLKAKPQPGGFVMQKVDGVTSGRAINFSEDSCIIEIRDYSRWDTVKADVDRYLKPLLQLLQKHGIPIKVLGLQYTDVFHWKSEPKDLVIGEVFNKDTPYLVPHVFDSSTKATSLWHSHHGFFVEHTEPVEYRRLDNINVSRVRAGASDSIQILTSHKAQFLEPLWKGGKENRPVISKIQDAMHLANKEIMRGLLTPELQKKIKLD